MTMPNAAVEAAAGLPPLTAILYEDGPAFGRLSRRIAALLARRGLACVGFVQHDELRDGRSRCDMVLENLQSGLRICISQDRGAEARGCRLDPDALVTAVEEARRTLVGKVDALLLSKFGKSEAEGSGFRPLIAEAIETGIPIVIGVPQRNVASWRGFADDLAFELEAATLETASDQDVLAALGVNPTPTAVE
jgi:nucleoside-triphosphatase THEP1